SHCQREVTASGRETDPASSPRGRWPRTISGKRPPRRTSFDRRVSPVRKIRIQRTSCLRQGFFSERSHFFNNRTKIGGGPRVAVASFVGRFRRPSHLGSEGFLSSLRAEGGREPYNGSTRSVISPIARAPLPVAPSVAWSARYPSGSGPKSSLPAE